MFNKNVSGGGGPLGAQWVALLRILRTQPGHCRPSTHTPGCPRTAGGKPEPPSSWTDAVTAAATSEMKERSEPRGAGLGVQWRRPAREEGRGGRRLPDRPGLSSGGLNRPGLGAAPLPWLQPPSLPLGRGHLVSIKAQPRGSRHARRLISAAGLSRWGARPERGACHHARGRPLQSW